MLLDNQFKFENRTQNMSVANSRHAISFKYSYEKVITEGQPYTHISLSA